ncbi:ABC transporter ATP-binding protein [Staphylococcus sp. 17KM0847]|uniref:ABC transporter ATP-binding protein n=1 Tax=Staphylococcus sp. 17KM0847 TaxID=2583989 RepID=UPI0015DC5A9E|nr:ABC transporter ATP-binding protein [Staphylococcus sp. 17KM0847]QLK86393.1 ABC transporter ATP-binding protein [Staphylococcus sp. 17KM0847]
MIELTNICKSFGTKTLIQNFNYTIAQGDFVIIKGASGKGKSTLLNIIGLLESPEQGTIKFNGKVIHKEQDKLLLKRESIAYIYQNYGLLDHDTILKNLSLPLNISKKETSRMKDALNQVGLSSLDLKTKIYTCSGGEQQRIAIARAILKSPALIIADEPTGNLDIDNGIKIINLFKQFNRQGITIVMATHDPSFFNIGNKLINMDNL